MPPQPEGFLNLYQLPNCNRPLAMSELHGDGDSDDEWVDDRQMTSDHRAPVCGQDGTEEAPSSETGDGNSNGVEISNWRGLLSRFRNKPTEHGTLNSSDGVFGNLIAKEEPQATEQDGASSSQSDSGTPGYADDDFEPVDEPPTYAEASADATPSYWETTIMSSDWSEEVIVGDLPVGSFLHFVWNTLISVAFGYFGFFFTYLFHTSHAARGGSIAGFGATLIQTSYDLRTTLTVAPGAPPDELTPSDPNSFEDGPPIGYVMRPTSQSASQEAQPEHSNFVGNMVFIVGCILVVKGLLDYATARAIQYRLLRQQEAAQAQADANNNAVSGEHDSPSEQEDSAESDEPLCDQQHPNEATNNSPV